MSTIINGVDFSVRSASLEDAGALVSLMHELGYDTSHETIESQLNRYGESDKSAIFVAPKQGVVLGVISGHLIPALHERGDIGRITALVVADKVRSMGVASALLRGLEDWFLSNHCLRFEVTSGDHRKVAQRFYQSRGYVLDERRFLKRP